MLSYFQKSKNLNLKRYIGEDDSNIINSMSSFLLDSTIPTGPWTLYYHPSEGRDWTLPSFTSFGVMKSWREFHTVIAQLEERTLTDGMFFLMRGAIPPLWENCANVYGGAYSISVVKDDAGHIFVEYSIAAMLNSSMTDTKNVINGLSISPKKNHRGEITHNIIKLWNTNAAKYSNPADIVKLIPGMMAEDVRFTPFTEKKM
jgi:hypothetical protein